MSETDDRGWGWREPNNECAHGPYGSREEAVADARHGHDFHGMILVGRCSEVFDAIRMPDAADMADRLNDILCDEGIEAHVAVDPSCRDRADEALIAWAREYLEIDNPSLWVLVSEEEVYNNDVADPAEGSE